MESFSEYLSALKRLSGFGEDDVAPVESIDPNAPALPPEISYKDDGTEKLKMPPFQISGKVPDPLYIPAKGALGRNPATNASQPYNLEDTLKSTPVSTSTPFANMSSGPMSYANPADNPNDPFFYSKKNVIDPKTSSQNIPMSPAAAGTQPASAPLTKRETITRSEDPTIRKAEEGALSKLLNPESDSQIDEQQLLNDYLLALKNSKDNEAKLTTMNSSALDNSRLAMLGEGLSESASKMGNLMGKPTGSTMAGFGKEAGAIEQKNVDQQRKIYEGANPEVQLARTAQIATMLEGIRSSRAKSALEAGKIAIPKPGTIDPKKLVVPGYTLGSEITPDAKESIKLREAIAARDSFNQKIDQYIPLMKEVGGYEAYGDKANKINALSASLKSEAGKLFDMGVLQPYDLKRLDTIIADSTSTKGAIYQGIEGLGKLTGNAVGDTKAIDKLLASARELKQSYSDKVDNKAASLGYTKNQSAQSTPRPTQAAPRLQAGQGGSAKVYVKALAGDNRIKEFSREAADKLLSQKQPNGQPMYIEVGNGR